jgi:hypothetical protein
VTGRFLNVGGSAVSLGGGSAPVIEFISEQHVNGIGVHSYSSITGLQAGDLMVLFSMGAYRVDVPPTGWSLLADAGEGSFTITANASAKFATSSSETVDATFATSNFGNFSTLIVLRGPSAVWGRSAETFGGTVNSSALTFPTRSTGAAESAAAEALMFLTSASTGVTFTPSPASTATLLSGTFANNRPAYVYRLPYAATYSATPSTSMHKAGVVVHLG